MGAFCGEICELTHASLRILAVVFDKDGTRTFAFLENKEPFESICDIKGGASEDFYELLSEEEKAKFIDPQITK